MMHCLKLGLRDLQEPGRLIAADAGLSTPAAHLADGFRVVPRCSDAGFADAVERLCRDEGVGLIVPTIDTELAVYADARQRFEAVGVRVAVSSPETVAIAADKRVTNRWLRENGFPAVRQVSPDEALAGESLPPWIVKPAAGSASAGVSRVDGVVELERLTPLGDGWVLEELAPGDEHTIHTYVDRRGRCLAAVPCRRLEVRAGEVSKGVTVRDPKLIKLAAAVSERLPGAYGPLNIQCFLGAKGAAQIVEINARFGGGYPLVDRAGAPFARWLIEEALGGQPGPAFDDWLEDLAMLRYDDAVFVPGPAIRDRRVAERGADGAP